MSGTAVPSVSIVVPTYNRAALLSLTLQSVLLQEMADYEVWVVGDGCTDDSAAAVAALGDPRFQWVNLERNHRSPHAACGEGLQRARGEFVAYLCHDDLWFPWHLSGLLARLRESGADLAYDMAADVDPPEIVFCRGEQASFEQAILTHTSSYVHRRVMACAPQGWRDPYESGWSANAYFLLHAHRCGSRLSFVEQLGSITCGSGAWNTYAATEFPQLGYLQRLRRNPRGLATELLLLNAARTSRESELAVGLSLRDALRRTARHWAWRAYHAWGMERTPAKQLRQWQFARQRKRYNRKRGLPF